MRKLKIFAAVAALVLCRPFAAAEPAREFDPASVRTAVITTVSGDIEILSASGKARVEAVGSDDGCLVKVNVAGGRLVAEAQDKNRWEMGKGGKCRLGFKVYLPAGAPVRAETVSGAIAVSSSTAPLNLKTVSGDTRFDGCSGSELKVNTVSGGVEGVFSGTEMAVNSVSGDVNVAGLRGVADINTVSGAVNLGWDKTPAAGTVKINTVSGDAHITLPPDASATLVRNTKFAFNIKNSGKGFTVRGNADKEITQVGREGGHSFFIKMTTVSGKLTAPGQFSPEGEMSDEPDAGPVANFTFNRGEKPSVFKKMMRSAGMWFAMLLFAVPVLVVVFFLQNHTRKISAELTSGFARSCAVGVLAVIGFLPAVLVLVVSILGIVILPFFIMLYAVACVLGLAAFVHLLAGRIFATAGKPAPGLLGSVLTGYIAISLLLFAWLLFIDIGGISMLLGFVLFWFSVLAIMFGTMAGLGAVVVTRMGGLFESRGSGAAPVAAAPVVPAAVPAEPVASLGKPDTVAVSVEQPGPAEPKA